MIKQKFVGEELSFKVDGETSYGSRLEVKLPAATLKIFKVRKGIKNLNLYNY